MVSFVLILCSVFVVLESGAMYIETVHKLLGIVDIFLQVSPTLQEILPLHLPLPLATQ